MSKDGTPGHSIYEDAVKQMAERTREEFHRHRLVELVEYMKGLGSELALRAARAEQACPREELFTVKAMVANWRNVEEVTFIMAPATADQICRALDALGIVFGIEKEMAEIDAVMKLV